MTDTALPIDQALQKAIACHREGLLSEAERLYREILHAQSSHSDANHNLGILAVQTGRAESGLTHLKVALEANPGSGQYWLSYIEALRAAGKALEARSVLDQGIKHGLSGAAVDALKEGLSETGLFTQAVAHHLAGRLTEAEALYRQILRVNEDHTESLHLLGVIACQKGCPGSAVEMISKAVALDGEVAAYYSNLGTALQDQGKLTAATSCFKRALALKPDFAEAVSNLGNVLHALGTSDAALTQCTQAVLLSPDYAEAHNNRGNAFNSQGNVYEAFVSYLRALVFKPDHAGAQNNLGNLLQAKKRDDTAVALYRRALALRPHDAEATSNLGVALNDNGHSMAALAHFKHALSIRPADAEACAHQGNALLALGQLMEARRAMERAVALDPRRVTFYYSLVRTQQVTPDSATLAAMERLAANIAALDLGEQVELHFGLAKAYEDIGQHDRSFTHLLAGNALKRRQLAYDEKETLGLFERIRDTFSSILMGSSAGLGEPSDVPVFILGMPRSGTSLVEQILASHPRIFGAGERNDFARLVLDLGRDGPGYPEVAPTLSAQDLRQLGARYLSSLQSNVPASARITDKMPGNFAFAGLIHLVLPNARIIHTCRDPVDTCLSCFSQLFSRDQPFSYDLAELGRYYRAYEALMAHWRRVLPEGVMLEVQYEQLVDDLEGQARRLIAHCGLEWDDACLSFHQTKRAVHTASVTQVRRPIYKSSVGRWRPEAALLQPLLEGLGSR
jgi:tetratricopeptide (TPR) repeat protein